MIDKERIKKGIAEYSREQQVFLRLLRKRSYFTEHEFDSWYRGREFRRFSRVYVGKDTFILGVGVNGFTMWARMLELLQYMVMLGMVSVAEENGVIVYRLSNE